MKLLGVRQSLVVIMIVSLMEVAGLAHRSEAGTRVIYAGVNLSGAEFGSTLPGTYGIDYIYPTPAEVDYFMGKGMNTFRLPFMWERLQHSQGATFNAAEQARMDGFVNYATGQGAFVILDPHNFARYYGNIIGEATVPTSAFTDFWTKLATHYKANPRVIFNLVNEPHTMSSELWRDNANAAISAIRATGATNLILVPGNAWTGAWSWEQNWYGTANAELMLTIVDPGNNYAIEVHQYLDNNSSGTEEACVNETIGSERLKSFTAWLEKHGRRGFLGEFAGARNQTCYEALDDMLNYVEAHADVWLGWTYWSAGPWWDNYMFSLEPEGQVDRPQMAILSQHLPPGQQWVYLPIILKN